MNPTAADSGETRNKAPAPRMFADWLIAVIVMASIYAAALALAANMTPAFGQAEAGNQIRVLEFANALKLISAKHQIARTRCGLLAGAERNICDAESATDPQQTRMHAPATRRIGTVVAGEVVANDFRSSSKFDVALYRIHRQLP